MGSGFLLVLFIPTGRTFFELDLPRAVVMLAGVGIVGMAGSIIGSYGSQKGIRQTGSRTERAAFSSASASVSSVA